MAISGGNEKASITNLDAGGSIRVQFNPKEFTLQDNAEWKPKGNVAHPALTYEKGAPAMVRMDLHFDTTREGGSVTGSVDSFRALLEQSVSETKDGKPYTRPPYLQFSWGGFQFKCVLKDLNVAYLMFSPDGAPVRAKVTITLMEHMDASTAGGSSFGSWTGAMTGESLSGTQTVTVQAGQTLSSIASSAGVRFQDIARANGIANPMDLLPGTELVIPGSSALADAMEASSLGDVLSSWGDIGELDPFDDVGNLGDGLAGLFDGDGLGGLGAQLNSISDAIDRTLDNVVGSIRDATGAITDAAHDIEDTIDRIADRVDSTVDRVVAGVDAVADRVEGAIDNVADRVEGAVDNIADRVEGAVDNVADRVETAAGRVGAEVRETVGSVARDVGQAADRVEGAADALGNLFGDDDNDSGGGRGGGRDSELPGQGGRVEATPGGEGGEGGDGPSGPMAVDVVAGESGGATESERGEVAAVPEGSHDRPTKVPDDLRGDPRNRGEAAAGGAAAAGADGAAAGADGAAAAGEGGAAAGAGPDGGPVPSDSHQGGPGHEFGKDVVPSDNHNGPLANHGQQDRNPVPSDSHSGMPRVGHVGPDRDPVPSDSHRNVGGPRHDTGVDPVPSDGHRGPRAHAGDGTLGPTSQFVAGSAGRNGGEGPEIAQAPQHGRGPHVPDSMQPGGAGDAQAQADAEGEQADRGPRTGGVAGAMGGGVGGPRGGGALGSASPKPGEVQAQGTVAGGAAQAPTPPGAAGGPKGPSKT